MVAGDGIFSEKQRLLCNLLRYILLAFFYSILNIKSEI